MIWIMVILIWFHTTSFEPAPVSIVAEFNNRDACQAAINMIVDPLIRDQQFGAMTLTTCVMKGREEY